MTTKTDKYSMRAIDIKLYQACAEGSVKEVKCLIGQGANPSAPYWVKPWPDDLGPNLYTEDYYCVHEAAQNPDIRVIDLLVEHGADPNMCEYWGRQPLAYAGQYNSLEMVKHLVGLGNDPGKCDDDGGTVLSWSALNPDVRVLEFLISHGAGIGDACFGGTELDIALKEGSPDRVRFFVEHGSDLECISMNSFVDAPLENIRVLLECGLDPDYDDGYDEGRVVDILDPIRKALFIEFGAKPK